MKIKIKNEVVPNPQKQVELAAESLAQILIQQILNNQSNQTNKQSEDING